MEILTISSILRMERTHSAESVMAEVDTRRGCSTFSSMMLLILPCWKNSVIRKAHTVLSKLVNLVEWILKFKATFSDFVHNENVRCAIKIYIICIFHLLRRFSSPYGHWFQHEFLPVHGDYAAQSPWRLDSDQRFQLKCLGWLPRILRRLCKQETKSVQI